MTLSNFLWTLLTVSIIVFPVAFIFLDFRKNFPDAISRIDCSVDAFSKESDQSFWSATDTRNWDE